MQQGVLVIRKGSVRTTQRGPQGGECQCYNDDSEMRRG